MLVTLASSAARSEPEADSELKFRSPDHDSVLLPSSAAGHLPPATIRYIDRSAVPVRVSVWFRVASPLTRPSMMWPLPPSPIWNCM